MDNKININEDLSRCLSNIFAVSENYPELKANELYTKNSSKSLPNKYNLPNTHTVNTYINSDVFIDTNTNIQIQITK